MCIRTKGRHRQDLPSPSMNTLIVFHKSTDVPPHTTEIDVIPRKGDLLHIPSIGGRDHFPVARVIFLMTRATAGNLVLSAPDDSPQVRIHLGVAQAE
ncbi:MAG: hypothetical protein ABMA01_13435 [Chthoniobacteraceae bacterium]